MEVFTSNCTDLIILCLISLKIGRVYAQPKTNHLMTFKIVFKSNF